MLGWVFPVFFAKNSKMDGKAFQISAVKNGEAAEIRIIGHIGWETNAEVFRAQVDALVKAGIKDAHVYINSPGGSCFDAAEIVNIMGAFKGKITGEGGALVASAATYIALHCKTFFMPENGMFMVHRPTGSASGNRGDIAAYLKLLEDVETEYYNVFKKVVKDSVTFDKNWNSCDWWMTAREAKGQGFITDVKEKMKIDRETAAAVKACGCPFDIDYQPQNNKEMDVKTTAVLLGLPETATEAEVKAKLAENKKAADDLIALQAAQVQKEKAEMQAKVKAALDKAVVDKRIKVDCRGEWEKMLNDNFDTARKVLESISPVEKLSDQLVVSKEGNKTYRGKTFVQLQDENPELLAQLEKENPDVFNELFNETFKK